MLAKDQMSTKNPSQRVFERYAIYYTPTPGSALAHFGNRWFADDMADISQKNTQSLFGIEKQIGKKITETPRRYGLHGTLKAPFRLKSNISFSDLQTRLKRFAAHRRPFNLEGLQLTQIDSFLALSPLGNLSRLNQLAAQCLFAFEAFQAPLTMEEHNRRNLTNLSVNQRLNLELWDYPYVLDEFQFHITLTGNLPEKDLQQIKPMLSPVLKDVCSMPFEFDAICLFGDPGEGRQFQLLGRYSLECFR